MTTGMVWVMVFGSPLDVLLGQGATLEFFLESVGDW